MVEAQFDDLRDIAFGPDGTQYIGDGERLLIYPEAWRTHRYFRIVE